MKYSAPLASLFAIVLVGGILASSEAIPPLFVRDSQQLESYDRKLPATVRAAIIEDLKNRLGLPQETAFSEQYEPATWEGCLPTPGAPASPGDCQQSTHSGWKVKLEASGETQAKGQIWTYYASQTDGTFWLDGLESLNATVKAEISKRTGVAAPDLQIAAAELTFGACLTRADCLPGHTLAWRVALQNGQMFHLDLQGNEARRGLEMPESEAGLPLALKNAVLRDVADRDGLLTANLNVEGIKPITWNWCQGGGDRPTPPEMGICPNVEQSGWQMKVRSGPMRYVYYLQAGSTTVAPDGMQSLPQEAIARIQQDMARRDPSTINNMRVQQVSPQFFDSCLNAKPADLNCRQQVRAGWSVMAIGGGSSPNKAWFYNVDLLGDRVELVRTGTWHPVPQAPPLVR